MLLYSIACLTLVIILYLYKKNYNVKYVIIDKRDDSEKDYKIYNLASKVRHLEKTLLDNEEKNQVIKREVREKDKEINKLKETIEEIYQAQKKYR